MRTGVRLILIYRKCDVAHCKDGQEADIDFGKTHHGFRVWTQNPTHMGYGSDSLEPNPTHNP
jgi:hypothetical protein